MKLTALSVAAALLGRAMTSEDEALQELSQLGPQLKELTTMREFRAIVGAEFDNQTDPAKIVTAIRELKSSIETTKKAAAEQVKAAIKTTVENTVKSYEKALTVPLREMMVRNLTAELEGGKELEKTETLATLKSLGGTGITDRTSGADVGTDDLGDDEMLDKRAHELVNEDAELKALHQKAGFTVAFRAALVKADKELSKAAK